MAEIPCRSTVLQSNLHTVVTYRGCSFRVESNFPPREAGRCGHILQAIPGRTWEMHLPARFPHRWFPSESVFANAVEASCFARSMRFPGPETIARICCKVSCTAVEFVPETGFNSSATAACSGPWRSARNDKWCAVRCLEKAFRKDSCVREPACSGLHQENSLSALRAHRGFCSSALLVRSRGSAARPIPFLHPNAAAECFRRPRGSFHSKEADAEAALKWNVRLESEG